MVVRQCEFEDDVSNWRIVERLYRSICMCNDHVISDSLQELHHSHLMGRK